ncbi:MAG TPA: trigger factor [Bacteroidales bacterium]|nr:trigger factor [Bacteroidales bacterium]
MNITKELTADNTALLRVEVREEDYLEKVNKKLKEYQRKAQVPGFRPGKVPFGMVKKMFGTSLMADEVNKLVSENLATYLTENKIRMIGQPIPNSEKTGNIDWNAESNFDLFFDIGLSPEIDLVFSEQVKLDYYKITADEEHVDAELKRLAEQHGSMTEPEVSEENDWLDGVIIELDEEGNRPESAAGIETYINPASIAEEQQRQMFTGLRVNDTIDFELRSVFPSNKEIARLFGINEKDAEKKEGNYCFEVKKISRMIPAEMNGEFFSKVYPDVEEMDEAKFRNLIKEDIEKSFTGESDKKFLQDAVEKLMEIHEINLPEAFLKKYMLETNRDNLTPEDVEKDFGDVMKSLKWDMLKQEIALKHHITVSKEDVRGYVKAYFQSRYGQQLKEDDDRMNEVISKVLSKEEDAEQIESDIFNGHLLQLMKQTFTLNTIEVKLEEFIAMMSDKHDHSQHHDHASDDNGDHEHNHEEHEDSKENDEH